jgi:RNA polymerase-binding transcription factor DksA
MKAADSSARASGEMPHAADRPAATRPWHAALVAPPYASRALLADNVRAMNRPADTLTPGQRSALEAALRTRQRELRADIAAQLKTQDDPRLVGLRNRMEDTDDWAVADAMAAQDITLVSRDLAELANVEQALGRVADGSYGECVDCASPIPYARLAAYPAASRCVACQEAAEKRDKIRK